MGIGTHGLSRVTDYVGRIEAGGIDAAAQITVNAPAPALRLLDGDNGLGPAVAGRARAAAAEAARDCGIGAAFVTGGSHLGALAPYLYLAAEDGFAAITMTNTAPMIAPAGGAAARIGNNPVGFAVPDPDGAHFILDMALSTVSRSRVRAAARENRPIPADWATDADGRPTTDAAAALTGLMRAIGGDKGAGLALGIDLLLGVLGGAAMLTEVPNAANIPSEAQNLGQVFILIDADRLLPTEGRRERFDAARHMLATTPPIDADRAVRMPGDRALASLRKAEADGVEIDVALLDRLRTFAGR